MSSIQNTTCKDISNNNNIFKLDFPVVTFEIFPFFQSLPLKQWKHLKLWFNHYGRVFHFFNTVFEKVTAKKTKNIYNLKKYKIVAMHFFSNLIDKYIPQNLSFFLWANVFEG